MKITPLAADSMGVRSMATFIETGSHRVLIDPGARIEALRFGLVPHVMEKWCLEKHLELIRLFARSTDIIVITHYHDAHLLFDDPGFYHGKTLYVKNPNQSIDANQRSRAFTWLRSVRRIAEEVVYADGRTIVWEAARMVFSKPVPHGSMDKREFVIQVAVHEHDTTFLFTSDVEGLVHDKQIEFILEQNPGILYLDGPETYPQGGVEDNPRFKSALRRLQTVLEKTRIVLLIIDHHLLRDLQWKSKIQSLLSFAQQKGIRVTTAAGFRGEDEKLLEARRQQLYENHPSHS